MEPPHIKDAVSRIVVEIAKRDWPQEWSNMTADLNVIYAQGVTLPHPLLSVTSPRSLNVIRYMKYNHEYALVSSAYIWRYFLTKMLLSAEHI